MLSLARLSYFLGKSLDKNILKIYNIKGNLRLIAKTAYTEDKIDDKRQRVCCWCV